MASAQRKRIDVSQFDDYVNKAVSVLILRYNHIEIENGKVREMEDTSQLFLDWVNLEQSERDRVFGYLFGVYEAEKNEKFLLRTKIAIDKAKKKTSDS